MADGGHELYAEDEGVAGDYFLAGLDVVDAEAVGAPGGNGPGRRLRWR